MATIRLGSQIVCPIKLEKANNTTLFVTPSTFSQTILSNNPVYTRVSTYPVTYEIDANIIPENIKDGVEILGVQGNYKKEEQAEIFNFPEYSVVKEVDVNGKLKNTSRFIDLNGIEILDQPYILAEAYSNNILLTTANFDSIKAISGSQALMAICYNCLNLVSVSFQFLERVIGDFAISRAFSRCNKLESICFPCLSEITGHYCFGEAFSYCTNLKHVYFPMLNSDSFGLYTSQFHLMLDGVTGCTVHFPVYLEGVLGTWSDVVNGFNGTNTTVLFDLTDGYFRNTSNDLVYDLVTDSYISADA